MKDKIGYICGTGKVWHVIYELRERYNMLYVWNMKGMIYDMCGR